MTESSAEARIRELKRRLAIEPASPAFVSLAEEYRHAGRLQEALAVLKRGLARRPGYVSAQVALGRVLLESGETDEAIAMFTQALVGDPGNLVSARSLADIYCSRGEKLEAIKKYKLYRGLSGDQRVDEVIGLLEGELAAKPAEAPAEAPAAHAGQSPDEPRGRILADLYFPQGQCREASAIYEEPSSLSAGDEELARRRDEARALANVSAPPSAPAEEAPSPDPGREEKIRALRRWLSVVQGR